MPMNKQRFLSPESSTEGVRAMLLILASSQILRFGEIYSLFLHIVICESICGENGLSGTEMMK